jgi:hypothetical protein
VREEESRVERIGKEGVGGGREGGRGDVNRACSCKGGGERAKGERSAPLARGTRSQPPEHRSLIESRQINGQSAPRPGPAARGDCRSWIDWPAQRAASCLQAGGRQGGPLQSCLTSRQSLGDGVDMHPRAPPCTCEVVAPIAGNVAVGGRSDDRASTHGWLVFLPTVVRRAKATSKRLRVASRQVGSSVQPLH